MNFDDFHRYKVLGQGAFAKVLAVRFKDEQLETAIVAEPQKNYALKEMERQRFWKEGRLHEVFVEKAVLANLNHPSIVKYFKSFTNGNKIYLLMEYCIGGSLEKFLSVNGKLPL